MKECSIDGCASASFCRGWCTKHYTRWQRHGDPLVTTRRPPIQPDATEAFCPRCETTKSIVFFGKRSAQAAGRRKGYCRDCEAEYLKARLENKAARDSKREAARRYARSARNRELRLAKLYGITVADYDAMVEAQGNRCAICQTETITGNATYWHVDHDHATGRIRGLLCHYCNLGLGSFKDDPELLRRAVAYLGTPDV